MFAVLAKILGSGDVASKSLDLIDSMHTSGARRNGEEQSPRRSSRSLSAVPIGAALSCADVLGDVPIYYG